ncbi:MAG TPA: hypothetical protein VE907_01770 [Gammaproteobacteria bacterium]|nr:hypothetical protein [Gammaproteobacteria bacterium]
MRRSIVGILAITGLVLVGRLALAHSAICTCFLDKGDKVTCEGGFSDGSSATGVPMRVLDGNDKLLVEGKMDKDGTFTFKKPTVEYHVVFDAGQGHLVTIDGGDITE